MSHTPSHSHLGSLDYLGSASDYVEDIYEVLGDLALFERFTPVECVELCKYMSCYAAVAHAPILNEGTEGDFLIIVLTGGVDVVKRDATGIDRDLAHVEPGGVLGEMSLIDGQARFASCVATQPTDFAILTREGLAELLAAQPALGNKLLLLILQLVTARLRETTTRMLPVVVQSDLI